MQNLMLKLGLTLSVISTGFLYSLSASAATIVNGGFENPSVTPGSFQNFNAGDDIGGWTAVGNTVFITERNYEEISFNGVGNFISQEGNNSLDLTGPFNQGVSNGIQQQISTISGQAYLLSFYVGVANGNFRNNYSIPSVVTVSINGNQQGSFTNSNLTPGTINWQQFSLDFTATGANTTIAFFNGISSPNNNFVGLDNVSISNLTEVPTPALLPGLIGMGIATIRKRKQEAEKVV